MLQLDWKLLEKKIGLESTQKLVENAGLSWDYLQQESNWVSESFAENFYQQMEKFGFQEKDSVPRNLELEYSDCSTNEKRIIEILNEPKTRDEILRALELPASEVNMLLSIMELKGIIMESLGEVRLT